MNTKQTINSVRSHVKNEPTAFNLVRQQGVTSGLHGLFWGVVYLGGLLGLITVMNWVATWQGHLSLPQQIMLIGGVAYGLYRATGKLVRKASATQPFKPGVKYHVANLPEGAIIMDEAGNVIR